MKSIILAFVFAAAAWAQCGKMVPNPQTGKMDCVGTSATTAAGWTDNGTTVSTTRNVSVGNSVVDAVTGINNPVPALLPKWRLALAKVLTGQSDARILCIGDSTTAGYGAGTLTTDYTLYSYPQRLVALLNAHGIPAAMGMAVLVNDTTDTRWTIGAGWGQYAADFGFVRAIGGFSPAGNLVFAPTGGASYDKFDIYYLGGGGLGTLTATATGGTPVVQATGGGPGVISKFTATTGAAGAGKAVTISATGTVYIVAVETWLSTTNRVRVGNVGMPGATTTDWADSTEYGPVSAVIAGLPDLSFISLGINDAGASTLPVTLQTNLSTLITASKRSGDVVIITMPPSQTGLYATFEPQYQSVFTALSHTYSTPIVDIWNRFGGTYQASFMHDALHPNTSGYSDWALAVTAVLAP